MDTLKTNYHLRLLCRNNIRISKKIEQKNEKNTIVGRTD